MDEELIVTDRIERLNAQGTVQLVTRDPAPANQPSKIVCKFIPTTSPNPPIELQVLEMLQPHTRYFPKILSVSKSPDSVLLEIKHYKRGDLQKVESGCFPDVAHLIKDLTAAVKKLHKLGISHGRITPDHVLISSRWRFKLTGFSHAVIGETSGNDDRYHRDIVDLGNLLQTCIENVPSKTIFNTRICSIVTKMIDEKITAKYAYHLVKKELERIDSVEPISVPISLSTRERVESISKVAKELLKLQHPMQEIDLGLQVKDLVEMLNEHGGRVFVSLAEQTFTCLVCASIVLEHRQTSLVCGHRICIQCLNRICTNAVIVDHSTVLRCPICATEMNPFSQVLFSHLEPNVIASLDEQQLHANSIFCPQCGVAFGRDKAEVPFTIICAECKYKFCSFCLKKAHYFSCGRWRRRRRIAGSR